MQAVAKLFIEIGFRFAEFELDDVALRVLLDWDRGIELVAPTTNDPDNPVRPFLDAHGDGVTRWLYTAPTRQKPSRPPRATDRRRATDDTAMARGGNSRRSRPPP